VIVIVVRDGLDDKEECVVAVDIILSVALCLTFFELFSFVICRGPDCV